MILIHSATYKDVFDIYDIQCKNYSEPSFWESRAFIHHVVSSGMSFVAKTQDGQVLGYILSHYLMDPSNPPKLSNHVPNHGNHLFIHDTCVMKEFHCQGIASKLVEAVHRLAKQRNIHSIYIIAVKGSQPFWIKHGYSPIAIKTTWDIHSQYQNDACYMHFSSSTKKGVP